MVGVHPDLRRADLLRPYPRSLVAILDLLKSIVDPLPSHADTIGDFLSAGGGQVLDGLLELVVGDVALSV